jgi:hypothetical protein
MKGKRVGVQRGTTADMYLSKFWGPRGMDVVRYEDQDKAYADLVNGRLDASFQDELQVEAGFLKSEPGKAFAFVGPSINGDNAAEREVLGSGAGMAVRKEDKALLDKLNKAIAPCAPMARSEAERAVLRPRYLLINGFPAAGRAGWACLLLLCFAAVLLQVRADQRVVVIAGQAVFLPVVQRGHDGIPCLVADFRQAAAKYLLGLVKALLHRGANGVQLAGVVAYAQPGKVQNAPRGVLDAHFAIFGHRLGGFCLGLRVYRQLLFATDHLVPLQALLLNQIAQQLEEVRHLLVGLGQQGRTSTGVLCCLAVGLP